MVSRRPPPSLIITMESPIFISAGLPSRYSPPALNTALRNPTNPETSGVKILGVIVCQPCGVKLLTCSPEEQAERRSG